MRLLNVHSRHLHTFYDDAIPPYAILSHTWDHDAPEVSFEDMKRPDHTQMKRYDKIEHTCRLAAAERLDWVWIDTCCIDKSSSAELSEAINSMFRWYEKSRICFVHLEDACKEMAITDPDAAFSACRWFTRGWTLQELLAPRKLVIYDKAWEVIGDRATMSHHLESRTAIPRQYLGEPRVDFRRARVGQRMSWASDRKTTRKEDMSYCLFGIFDVNMPLLYGEGDRAFRRLQEEIMKTSQDDSIFAWSSSDSIAALGLVRSGELFARDGELNLLAPSPLFFRCLKHKDILPGPRTETGKTWEMAKGKLQARVPMRRYQRSGSMALMLLDCALDGDIDQILAIRLFPTQLANEYARFGICIVSWEVLTGAHVESISIIPNMDAYWKAGLIESKNWLQVNGLLLKVAAGLGDRILATRYLYCGDQATTDEFHPDRLWLRIAVHLRSDLTDYILVVERLTFSLALWVHQDWLCRPFAVYIIKSPVRWTLFSGILLLDTSSLSLQANMGQVVGRATRQEETYLVGSHSYVIEIHERTISNLPYSADTDDAWRFTDPRAPVSGSPFYLLVVIYLYYLLCCFLIDQWAPKTEDWDQRPAVHFFILLTVTIVGPLLSFPRQLSFSERVRRIIQCCGKEIIPVLDFLRLPHASLGGWNFALLLSTLLYLGLEVPLDIKIPRWLSVYVTWVVVKALGAALSVFFPRLLARGRMMWRPWIVTPVLRCFVLVRGLIKQDDGGLSERWDFWVTFLISFGPLLLFTVSFLALSLVSYVKARPGAV